MPFSSSQIQNEVRDHIIQERWGSIPNDTTK